MTLNETAQRDTAGPDLSHLNVALLAVTGSTAYGLAHEGSDVDRLGVYLCDPRDLLGLDGGKVSDHTHVTSAPEPDSAVHELGKFCRLALRSNPTVLELLFAEAYEVCTDVGADLIGLRSAFLSAPNVRQAYGGYATAQAHRLLARTRNGLEGFGSVPASRTAKHARHCMRVLRQGRDLLATGTLSLNVSAIREELFAAGDLAVAAPQAFVEMFEAARSELDTMTTVLPDRADVDRVDYFVRRTRLGPLRCDQV